MLVRLRVDNREFQDINLQMNIHIKVNYVLFK